MGLMVFKLTGLDSRFQCKNWFSKICTEFRDIGQNVSNFSGLVWKTSFGQVFGNILGLGTYFSNQFLRAGQFEYHVPIYKWVRSILHYFFQIFFFMSKGTNFQLCNLLGFCTTLLSLNQTKSNHPNTLTTARITQITNHLPFTNHTCLLSSLLYTIPGGFDSDIQTNFISQLNLNQTYQLELSFARVSLKSHIVKLQA